MKKVIPFIHSAPVGLFFWFVNFDFLIYVSDIWRLPSSKIQNVINDLLIKHFDFYLSIDFKPFFNRLNYRLFAAKNPCVIFRFLQRKPCAYLIMHFSLSRNLFSLQNSQVSFSLSNLPAKQWLKGDLNISLFQLSGRAGRDWMPLLRDVSEEIDGIATILQVDCGASKKLCKRFKVNPSPIQLKHYKWGRWRSLSETDSSYEFNQMSSYSPQLLF